MHGRRAATMGSPPPPPVPEPVEPAPTTTAAPVVEPRMPVPR
jgi:hypothetical protein